MIYQLQDGGTPLFVACQCGHLDVVEYLIAKGANVNAHMKVKIKTISAIHLLITNKTSKIQKYVDCEHETKLVCIRMYVYNSTSGVF